MYNVNMQKGFSTILILLGMLVVSGGLIGGVYYFSRSSDNGQKACALDVRICPDGSSVGRVGPNCEFAACPATLAPSPSPEIDNLSACISEQEKSVSEHKTNYAKGQLIVSFTTADEEQAKSIVKSYGLDIFKESPSYNGWLLVKVPELKEFEWICRLEKDTNIKYAELNAIVSAN